MAKFLYTVSYTVEGVKGLIRQGGSARAAAVGQLMTEMGGTMEAFYYAFGSDDLYMIAELPDHKSAAAFALAVTAAGAASIKTTVLISPSDIDGATHVCVNYLPPEA